MFTETTKKPIKIFISHSSQDIAFVKPIVDLFENIGINENNMFCSSVIGYKIPLGNNILEYLKNLFKSYDLRVIYVLSENYYNSPICLMEMGATWVLQHRYTSILLPQFDFSDIKGAINNMDISIKLDSDKSELKARLNELRDMLIKELNLEGSSQNKWERHRDEFVDKMSSMESYWKHLQQLEESNRPFNEWIFPLQKLIEVNPVCYDAMYMSGSIYVEIKDYNNAIKYLKMTERMSQNKELKDKASKRLQELGYTL